MFSEESVPGRVTSFFMFFFFLLKFDLFRGDGKVKDKYYPASIYLQFLFQKAFPEHSCLCSSPPCFSRFKRFLLEVP